MSPEATLVFLTLDGHDWHFHGIHTRVSALALLGKAKHEAIHDRIEILELPGGKLAYSWTRESQPDDTHPKG
jgi:hypothetical protein